MFLLQTLIDESGLTGDEVVIVLIAAVALFFVISVLLLFCARRRKCRIRELEKGKTKTASSTALQDLEKENQMLRDENWRLKTKLADEQYGTKVEGVEVGEKKKELEEKLLKISALEDEIDFLRTRVGELEKEKEGTEVPVGEAARGEMHGKMYDEAEVESIKAETMLIVERFAKEKDEEIERLNAENEKLREQIEKSGGGEG